MPLDALAYDEEAQILLVLDRTELCGYDASTEAPRWAIKFDDKALAGVFFAHPHALPPMGGASPWREAAAERIGVVVDIDGALHAVELTLGQKHGPPPPIGKPRAFASSVGNQLVAIATEEKVHLWHAGVAREIALANVSALAFSRDGKSLSAGTDDGQFLLIALDGTNAEPESIARGIGSVTSIAAHVEASFVATTETGAFQIANGRSSSLERLYPGARRVAFSPDGKRLAVQRSDRAVTVYAWPSFGVVARIEYVERPVRGIAFGPGNWLGLALDHGDGNKIDVITSATHRTDTVPGRQHRSWLLRVEGQSRVASREGSTTQRSSSTSSGPGLKFGIVGGLSAIVLGLRVCALAMRASTPSYSLPPSYPPSDLLSSSRTCDVACADTKLAELSSDCALDPALDCTQAVAAIKTAIHAGRCAEARSKLEELDDKTSTTATLWRAHLVLARPAIDGCKVTNRPPAPPKSVQVVHIPTKGDRSVERPGQSEYGIPQAVHVTSDGSIFLAADTLHKVAIYKRSPAGLWHLERASHSSFDAITFTGRSSNDLYVTTGDAIEHYDGKAWTVLARPDEADADSAALSGTDLIASTSNAKGYVFRRSGTEWKKEKVGDLFEIGRVAQVGPAAWAIADGDETTLFWKRSGAAWSKVVPTTDHISSGSSIWGSADGRDVFLGTSRAMYHSRDGGTTFATEGLADDVFTAVWGRSSKDVYALDGETLKHYDGTSWTKTTTLEGARSLTGTATDLFVVTYAP